MPVSLVHLREILLPGLRENFMTVPAGNAWYPLGGHVMTAHSSSVVVTSNSTAGWVEIQQAQAIANEQMAAQMFHQGTICTSTAGLQNTVAFSTAGEPETFRAVYEAAAAVKASTDATIRSMELLYEWLDEKQRKMLAIRNYFDVVGGDTGRRYRLYPPAPYNIHKLHKDSDETENKLCFTPKDQSLPKGDIWLCQKLALELDERNTLDIANHQANYCPS